MLYLNTSPIIINNLVVYPDLNWAGNNICAQVNSVQLGVILQQLSTFYGTPL